MSRQSSSAQSSSTGETIRIVIHALIIALVIRTFLFQPFSIPSGSMKSTLLIGDYLFVSKYSYGYSRFSFPFGPSLFSGRTKTTSRSGAWSICTANNMSAIESGIRARRAPNAAIVCTARSW